MVDVVLQSLPLTDLDLFPHVFENVLQKRLEFGDHFVLLLKQSVDFLGLLLLDLNRLVLDLLDLLSFGLDRLFLLPDFPVQDVDLLEVVGLDFLVLRSHVLGNVEESGLLSLELLLEVCDVLLQVVSDEGVSLDLLLFVGYLGLRAPLLGVELLLLFQDFLFFGRKFRFGH